MAYIGKQPVVGNFVKLDTITTSATTTFNLTNGGVAYFPQSANNCLVSLNGILQAPTDSYTISGSTIIFSSALTTSDVIDFIIVLGDVLNIGTPSDATVGFAKVTSNLITGATAETSIAGGDSVLIYDDSASALRKMTRTNFVSGIGGANTPAFQAYPSTTQSISENTFTKVTYGTETFDSDSNFASSTFTPTTAGKYFVYSNLSVYASATSAMSICWNQIRKNGSGLHHLALDNRGSNTYYAAFNVSAIVDMNGTTDYLEIYTYVDSTNNNGGTVDTNSTFGAYKLIGV